MLDKQENFSLSNRFAVDSLTATNNLRNLTLVDQQHIVDSLLYQCEALYLQQILVLNLGDHHNSPLEGQVHGSFADVALNEHDVWVQPEQGVEVSSKILILVHYDFIKSHLLVIHQIISFD